jgi:hypothetical protein
LTDDVHAASSWQRACRGWGHGLWAARAGRLGRGKLIDDDAMRDEVRSAAADGYDVRVTTRHAGA